METLYIAFQFLCKSKTVLKNSLSKRQKHDYVISVFRVEESIKPEKNYNTVS